MEEVKSIVARLEKSNNRDGHELNKIRSIFGLKKYQLGACADNSPQSKKVDCSWTDVQW